MNWTHYILQFIIPYKVWQSMAKIPNLAPWNTTRKYINVSVHSPWIQKLQTALTTELAWEVTNHGRSTSQWTLVPVKSNAFISELYWIWLLLNWSLLLILECLFCWWLKSRLIKMCTGTPLVCKLIYPLHFILFRKPKEIIVDKLDKKCLSNVKHKIM